MKVRLVVDEGRFGMFSDHERWVLGIWGWDLDGQRKTLEGLGAELI